MEGSAQRNNNSKNKTAHSKSADSFKTALSAVKPLQLCHAFCHCCTNARRLMLCEIKYRCDMETETTVRDTPTEPDFEDCRMCCSLDWKEPRQGAAASS